MADAERESLLKSLFSQPRFGPALFAILLAGIMMLFLTSWESGVRLYLIPSLVIYSLGAALLGTLHRLLGLHYVKRGDVNNEKPIPCVWKWILLVLHLAWFAALVFYNFFRGVF